MDLKKMIVIIFVAAMAAAVATIITKSFGIENASPLIGGAVGGAVGGAIAGNFGKKQGSK